MIKSVQINEKLYTLKASAYVIILYKEQFGSDLFSDLDKISVLKKTKSKRLSAFNAMVAYRLFWTMIYIGNDDISDPETFMKGIPENELADLINQAESVFIKSVSADKPVQSTGDNTEPITAEKLAVCCQSCGISLSDMDKYSLSFILRYMDEYINIRSSTHKKKAVQADFDTF